MSIENSGLISTIDPSYIGILGIDLFDDDLFGVNTITVIAVVAITYLGASFLAAGTFPPAAVLLITALIDGAVVIVDRLFFKTSLDLPAGIDPCHFEAIQEIERNLPIPPENLDLNDLVKVVDEMNFTESAQEDFVGNSLMEEGSYFSQNPEAIKMDIERLLRSITSRPRGELEEISKRNMEVMLKHILQKMKAMESHLVYTRDEAGQKTYVDPRTLSPEEMAVREKQIKQIKLRNRALAKISHGMHHCEGRRMGEILEAYRLIVLHDESQPFEYELFSKLHQMREAIVREIVQERTPRVSPIMEVHHVLYYEKMIAPQRGILGSSSLVEYDDRYTPWCPLPRRAVFYYFDKKYSREKIIQAALGWINGIQGASGERHREMELAPMVDWFKQHVAEGYDEVRFLSEFVFDEAGLVREEAIIYALKTTKVIT